MEAKAPMALPTCFMPFWRSSIGPARANVAPSPARTARTGIVFKIEAGFTMNVSRNGIGSQQDYTPADLWQFHHDLLFFYGATKWPGFSPSSACLDPHVVIMNVG